MPKTRLFCCIKKFLPSIEGSLLQETGWVEGDKKFIHFTTAIVIISVTGLSITLAGPKKRAYTKNQTVNNKDNLIKNWMIAFLLLGNAVLSFKLGMGILS